MPSVDIVLALVVVATVVAAGHEIEAGLSRVAARLAAQLTGCENDNRELLDGTARTALALHTSVRLPGGPGAVWGSWARGRSLTPSRSLRVSP